MFAVKLILLSFPVFSYESSEITVWLNHIVSSQNPLETLPAYKLFSCSIKFKDDYYPTSLFEDLEDQTFIDSGMHLNLNHNTNPQHFCRISLTTKKKSLLKDLIISASRVEFRIKDHIFWVPVGIFDVSKALAKINTHYDLQLVFKGTELLSVNIEAKNAKIFEDLSNIDLWYSARWEESNKSSHFPQSQDLYSLKIENLLKFSTMINTLAVLVLSVLVFLWIRQDVNTQLELDEESQQKGWIGVRVQVQRSPQYSTLLTSLVSTGWHLGLSLLVVVCMNYCFQFYNKDGMFGASVICTYFALSGFSGFICGVELFKHKGKTNFWVLTLNTAAVNVLIFVLYVMKTVVNQHFMNFMHFVCVLLVFCLFYTPLYLTGFYFGKVFSKRYLIRYSEDDSFICQEKSFKKWLFSIFSSILVFILLLPQIDSVLRSRLEFFVYRSYDLLLLNLLIFLTSNSVLSVLLTYLTLESHHYDWQWYSFLTGSLVGVEYFLYLLLLLTFKFKVSSWLSLLYHILHSFTSSLILSLISGTTSYLSSSYLITKIYSFTKKL